MPARPRRPIVHVSPMGNLANQMIQYLVARSLACRVPDSLVSNVHLPLWGIEHANVQGHFPATEIVTTDVVALDRLATGLSGGAIDRVDLQSYGQNLANFPPVDECRNLFGYPGPPIAGAEPHELLCNIRQGDILDARHPDYVLIPADFYADLAARTGLAPVFMGQLDESPYLDDLRRRFPNARFLPSEGPAIDFERIRQSRFIVPSISTFGWLAAWLSHAETIFQPVLGLMHPRQSRSTWLLPLDDPRYEFHLFPFHYAVPVARYQAAHASLARLWRYLPSSRLSQTLRPPPPLRQKALYLEAFDEAYYLAAYPDIALAVRQGHLPSGRHHYDFYGFAEGRLGFYLDRAWYCQANPIAAIELSQGDFSDPDQHWLEVGQARGYLRAAA